MLQLSLFDPNPAPTRPATQGDADVIYADASAILARPTGRLADLDFVINPYQGCTFACTYCYAAFFVPEEEQRERWGQWVRVKTNAIAKLRNSRQDLRGKTVLMSSATDPYQPIEAKLELTRSLLPLLADRGASLAVLSRSPLVTRDIDLFKTFERINITISITTDDDEVRKRFEPQCASIDRRFAALRELNEAGFRTRLNVAPLLPLADPQSFAERILETGVSRVHINTFHEASGPFASGTRQPALAIADELGWTEARRTRVERELRSYLNQGGRQLAA
ncbi:MAG: radical SAM protein [Chloroflexi bacterium]|nr:radical SAM protein [Chloroflexota bacterium]MYD16185.1 radical SAM protein [Chloroflexota bacterium]MYJ02689.1 radical SAM protein [Chloroflexota bacterium]